MSTPGGSPQGIPHCLTAVTTVRADLSPTVASPDGLRLGSVFQFPISLLGPWFGPGMLTLQAGRWS